MSNKLTDVTDNNVEKISDNEIIKALECCSADKSTKYCLTCPLQDMGFVGECIPEKSKNALDLINRQKEEIERLQSVVDSFTYIGKMYSEIKAEAYKEFAEDVQGEIENAIHSNYNAKAEANKNKKRKAKDKENFLMYCDGKIQALSGIYNYIDNLLKEMVGEDNA